MIDASKEERDDKNLEFVYTLNIHAKENGRLLNKLKKSGQEREALRKAYEELKAKERQYVMRYTFS